MSVFIPLLFLIVSFVFLYLKYLLTYWSRRGIPHDEPEFPSGNVHGWRNTKHLVDILDPMYAKYKGTGPFAGLYFMLMPLVLPVDIELINNILTKDFNYFSEGALFHNERDDPLTGTLTNFGADKWRTLRNKLSPTFSSGNMKNMFPIMRQTGAEFATVFAENVKSDNHVLEITNLMDRFTADVIGRCAFGLGYSLSDPAAEFCATGKRVFMDRRPNFLIESLMKAFPIMASKWRMRQIQPDLHEFYIHIVRETVDYRERTNIKRDDYVSMLIDLKNNNTISFNELAAQAFEFFVAGFEGASTTMGYALYELAGQQHIQDKLRSEIREVLKRHTEFTYEAMMEMRYMNQVLLETLRKYPVATQLVCRATSRYETSDPNYYIEKGTTVIIPVSSVHYDPEFYPEPNNFDPGRFSYKAVLQRPSSTWFPFGAGRRSCIGTSLAEMQVTVGLCYLIANFNFTPCELSQNCSEFAKEDHPKITDDGIYLRINQLK